MQPKFQEDRFKEYLEKVKTVDLKMAGYIAEHKQLTQQRRDTGRATTLVRYELENLEFALKNLDKLIYEYQRAPDKHLQINDKEKRIATVEGLRSKFDKTIREAKEILHLHLQI